MGLGQQRKFEVLGWGLVINNDDNTGTIINGSCEVNTQNEAIEVRAFNPHSEIQAWANAQGIEILNPEILETAEPETKRADEPVVIGKLIKPTFLEPKAEDYAPEKLKFWRKK